MADNNTIIEKLQNELYNERQQHATTQINFKLFKETHWHYAWTLIFTLFAAIVTSGILLAVINDIYGPIVTIQDKRLLISCPDGSTQWAPMPQCKEIK